MTVHDIMERLDAMSPRAVQQSRREVEQYLDHRRSSVRSAAAHALERAGFGAAALRRRLASERDEIVTVDLCEALTQLDDRASLPLLARVAREHRSSLARMHAAWAAEEIAGRRAVPLLREIVRTDGSPRVRAAARAALLKQGQRDVLPALFAALQSRDYRVRTMVANAFGENLVARDDKDEILAALQRARKVEVGVAPREAMDRAIDSVRRW